MSKFKKNFKKLGGMEITTHALNDYKERVTDDPLLERDYTAIDIERRIRSALNRCAEGIMLGTAVAYKARFTKKGSDYYILVKNPKVVVGVWTEEIYNNYLNGITSKGNSIYEKRQ